MSRSESAEEWELSKENVQPLRSGRKVASMNTGLQSHTGDEIAKKIKEEKQFYETELRTYTGDDPLDVWDRYIKWSEQTYPKGGRDSKMSTLLERCIITFKDDARYKNDPRYVEIWIRFVNFLKDPLEIFSYMFDQGIGCQVAALYEAWAWAMEQAGNPRKADALFQEGLHRGAQPLDRLAKSHQEFQARVARSAMSGVSAGEEDMQMEEQRTVLGHLKPSGRHHAVGTSRTGPALQAPRGLGVRSDQTQKQTGMGFQIFTDENSAPSAGLQQTGEWVAVPQPSDVDRENERKPGMWTKAKVPQKSSGVVPISSLSTKAQTTFTVHIDEDQEMETPRKDFTVEPQVLSTRKVDKQLDPLQHVRCGGSESQAGEGGGTQRPMYCKDKVYTGVDEFSLEEIRAARYLKRKRKLEERRRFQEMQETIARQQHELHQARSEMQRTHVEMQQFVASQMAQEREALRQEFCQLLVSQHDRVNKNCQAEISAQQQMIERNIESHLHGLQPPPASLPRDTKHLHRDSSSARQLSFEERTGSTENLPLSLGESLRGSGGMRSAETSLNSSHRTPSFQPPPCLGTSGSGGSLVHSGEPTPSSGSFSMTRRSLAAPSPTVHTREAMQMVMGMFNSSLEGDRHFSWNHGQETELSDFAPVAACDEPRAVAAHAPITIYNEYEDNPTSSSVADNDKENNRPGLDYQPPAKRRGHLSVLRDSKRVPVDPRGEHDYELPEPVAEVEKTEAIVSQARDDEHTIGIVGSHESFNFAAAARFASTPFGPKLEGGSVDGLGNTSAVVASSCLEESTQPKPAPKLHNTTPNSSTGTPGKSALSPIMEGSQESSSEESKSAASSAASSRLHNTTAQHRSTADQATVHQQIPAACSSTTSHFLAAGMPAAQTARASPLHQHVIDTSGFVLPDLDEHTEAIMNQSIRIDPQNPFDEDTIASFLNSLQQPLSSYENYISVNGPVPNLHFIAFVGDDKYSITECIGEGGFAKVYRASPFSDDYFSIDNNEEEILVIKVQKPPCPWEFYMCCEVHRRLTALQADMDVRQSVMAVKKGYFFSDGSCLVSDFVPLGSLLNLVNKIKAQEKLFLGELEPLAVFLTIELLHIMEKLHRCHIIHGDVKPDNFLLLDLPNIKVSKDPSVVFGSQTQCLQLIDFGNSIDMTKFPSGSTFLAKVKTNGFQCIEMMTDRPWTYQTDLFGLLGTVHVLVFGEYMKVYQVQGEWNMTSSFVRKWNVPLWKRFFKQLLNIPSCDQLPDLASLRQQFQDYFMSDLISHYNAIAEKVLSLL